LVTIAAVALQPDPVNATKTALMVGGTTGNDVIKFSKDRSGGVKVVMNKVTLGVFNPTGRVVAFGQAGNDDISIGATILLPAEFYGGEGNDKLKAGKAGSILVGGPGNDKLSGGAGRDLLIGGDGADQLSGSTADDIAIAGRTLYDDILGALRALLAEWSRTDIGYAARIDNLQNRGVGNGLLRLNAAAVADDGLKDQLTGGAGLDWLFAGAPTIDKVTGRQATETLTREPVPGTFAIAWSAQGGDGSPAGAPEETFSGPSLPEFTIEDEDDPLVISV
jgi:Ca2+-binding RTX toxin-like protein